MFLKKAARNKAVRHIVKRQLGVAVANAAIYSAYKVAANKQGAAKYARSAPPKGLTRGKVAKMVKPKRGVYKISKV